MFKYFGIAVANKNCINEVEKNRLNLGSTCYRSFQNLLSRLLSSAINIKIDKLTVLPVDIYGALTLRGDRMSIFGNKVLRIMSGREREEVTGWIRELLIEELHSLYY
jgi:hypothetical protein